LERAIKSLKTKSTALKVGLVILVALIALILLTVVGVYLFPYDGVQFPATCRDVSNVGSNITSVANGYSIHTAFLFDQTRTSLPLQYIRPDYALRGIGSGVLLTSDPKSAVVVVIDFSNSRFNSTLFLVNKTDQSIVKEMSFTDDFLAATIDNNILYIFNSGLGYILNSTTGAPVDRIVTIDNYRDVSVSDNNATLQTTAFIAGLYPGRGLNNQPNLAFNDIAYGCITLQSETS
jgi:hypothetical protein